MSVSRQSQACALRPASRAAGARNRDGQRRGVARSRCLPRPLRPLPTARLQLPAAAFNLSSAQPVRRGQPSPSLRAARRSLLLSFPRSRAPSFSRSRPPVRRQKELRCCRLSVPLVRRCSKDGVWRLRRGRRPAEAQQHDVRGGNRKPERQAWWCRAAA